MWYSASKFSNRRRNPYETISPRNRCNLHGFDGFARLRVGGNEQPPPPPPPPSLTNPHPPFSIIEGRTLDLRETGSQIVVDTIENALRLGGIGLFDERFQFDSSVNWVFGESIEGELDALIPAWDSNGHVVFVQPGIVFWSGIEEEKRIDANLGAVYRTEVFDGIVGGVNLFYDNDFKMGHSRISVGVDAQMDDLYGAFNYYVPLTDTQDGREGYVEDALEGMDAILGIENEAVRFSGNVGYWTYQGDENTEDEMEFSYGIDGGIRIFPGFFLEGSLQQHDDASIGSRASVGVAVRFSLPDLTGKSYGDNGGVSNLYKFVERERRILYEERESHGIFLLPDGSVVEGGTVNVAVQLRKAAVADVVINLVGTGSATYGTDGDWTISVGGEDCTAVTGTSCSVTVAAGETMPADNIVITINNDGRGEDAETIVLSTIVASGDTSLTGRPLVLTIPIDPPLPTVSLSADSTSITEGNTATLTLTLNEMLEENATFNLIGSGNATYGTSADWNLSVGGVDCNMANQANPCEVMIAGDETTAEVIVEVNADLTAEPLENFTVSVAVASGSTSIVQEGSRSSVGFTIPGNTAPPTVSLNDQRSGTTIGLGVVRRLRIELSRALTEEVTLNLTTGGNAVYGVTATPGEDWNIAFQVVPMGGQPLSLTSDVRTNPCPTTQNICAIAVPAGSTVVDVDIVTVSGIGRTITLSLAVAPADSTKLALGSSTSLEWTIVQ